MILPPEPDLAALRLHLARLRHDRGRSFIVLSERTGLSRQTVMDIEHGKTVGTLATDATTQLPSLLGLQAASRISTPLRTPGIAASKPVITPARESAEDATELASTPILDRQTNHLGHVDR
ncbi:hypothetical protein L3Q65_30885 [Amycolatopsis sp. FU40]|uniref:hypothetical protein n=1 Tax=Amycolatopsis sp. FU40 TaxID=2914159 RepID=UPI001F40B47A|nr:hypothetical protein [Amycolatopsis sp. FU40]UKD52300.1 hypothetical protein L3Q65_30885 [Amycolatopsis sp. FU40]